MAEISDQPTANQPGYSDWTDEELEMLSRVDSATLADARADALRSDPELAAFLDAEEKPE